jgi:hypothetical protein
MIFDFFLDFDYISNKFGKKTKSNTCLQNMFIHISSGFLQIYYNLGFNNLQIPLQCSVVEWHHVNVAQAPGKNFQMALAPAPTLLHIKLTFLKQGNVNIRVREIFFF